jgi:hypothetical protein
MAATSLGPKNRKLTRTVVHALKYNAISRMTSSPKSLLFLLLSGILFSACQPDEPVMIETYAVPEVVQPYIDRFELEAQRRGYDIVIDSLIVDFGSDLQGGDAAGLCTFANRQSPIPHIELDTTSYNWQNNEYQRETLIFHELGHCILNRRNHRDDYLPNGNITSIMRSTGEQLYGGTLNYFKREYYLDELFDVNTPAPDWATDFPPYSSTNGRSRVALLTEDFDDTSNGWTLGVDSEVSSRIANGRFMFEALGDAAYFSPLSGIVIDQAQDFELEASIRLVSGNRSAMLQWGGSSGADLNFFGFASDSLAFVGNWATGVSITKELPFFDPRAFNLFTVRKLGEQYHFYVNEQYFDVMEAEAFNGNLLAFYIGARSKMEVEYLYINQIQ